MRAVGCGWDTQVPTNPPAEPLAGLPSNINAKLAPTAGLGSVQGLHTDCLIESPQ